VILRRGIPTLVAVALSSILIAAGGAGASTSPVQISSDPFVNTDSQHQTEVEPDTFGYGNVVVAAFQAGRFTDGGSSGIGWARYDANAASWSSGFLPSLTVNSTPPGPWSRATDPSVAYDAAHGTWLIETLAQSGSRGAAVVVARSTNGGSTWSAPVTVSTKGTDLDKTWIVCDNNGASPHRGNCYATWDDNGSSDRLYNAVSSDGGLTWGAATTLANNGTGLGGQPLVQSNGTVIVPFLAAAAGAIRAYRSTDGGVTWTAPVLVSKIQKKRVRGGLRSLPLPSAAISGDRVYAAWHDCRFRPGCSSNDIVFSTSTDGVTWTAPSRIPEDPTSSGADHFIPGLAADPASSQLALTYYFYPTANCTAATCQLNVGQIRSSDGGATWGTATQLNATPMSVKWLASTTQGPMVGDYISTSFVGTAAVGAFALASAPDTSFHEAIWAAVG
jgi:hypothetical protein